ncbi:MAG: c-type cytochrome [Chloroflexi bacterium]|nr:c-type cytochrome [Chloroflexota bacterium]
MVRNLLGAAIGLLLLAGLGGLLFTFGFILSARSALDTPTEMQIRVADMGKNFLVPGDIQSQKNPVTLTDNTRTQARRLYTARCVVCHDVDGKGGTATGSHLYPRAADLTSPRTQEKSDGVLYWIVGNGLPHTGMPGWKTILNDTEIWQIVAYMRLLPQGVVASAEESPTPVPTATAQPAPPTPVPASPTAIATVAATATPAATTAAAATPIPTVVAPTQSLTRVPAAPVATAVPANPSTPATVSGSGTVAAPTLTIAVPAPTAAAIQATNTVTVSIEDYSYLPDKLTITAGTRVVWFNKDDDDHSVTSDDGTNLLDSSEFTVGKSFAHIFDKPGTYTYYCVPHDYMHGVVIVQ